MDKELLRLEAATDAAWDAWDVAAQAAPPGVRSIPAQDAWATWLAADAAWDTAKTKRNQQL